MTTTIRDLAALGGPSHRQLHYWYQQGWLSPDNPRCGSGNGSITFTPEQAERALAIWRFTEVGIPPAIAYQAVMNGGNLGHGIRLVIEDVQEDRVEQFVVPA